MAADLDAVRALIASRPNNSLTARDETILILVAEVEELRSQLTASRRQVRAAVACLTTPDTPRHDDGPLRPWQIAFRLRRAGLHLDGKERAHGTVIAEYQHPASHYIGAVIHVAEAEVGRR